LIRESDHRQRQALCEAVAVHTRFAADRPEMSVVVPATVSRPRV